MARRPPTLLEARYAKTTPKRIDATAEQVVLASFEHNEFSAHGPPNAEPPRWFVRFYSIDGFFRAMLCSVGRASVEALDHHAGRCRAHDGSTLLPGYHWDVFPPLATTDKHREPVDTASDDRYHMLQLVCVRWSITLNDSKQLGLV